MKEYIEREAALAICEQEYQERLKQADWCGDTVAWNIGGAIKGLPAADVVPVRHGRWIEDERTYTGPGLANNLCSVCGEIAGAWKEGLAPERKWAYCPACGALMDGKEDEHEASK